MVTWDESVRIARAAERAGFEAIIPVARWRSPSSSRGASSHRSFETFTWAAGLAASTTTIQVFAKVHIPTVHPVRAACGFRLHDPAEQGKKISAECDFLHGGRPVFPL